MEYVYAVLFLDSADIDVTRESITAVLDAAEVDTEPARVGSLLKALDGVDIQEAVDEAGSGEITDPHVYGALLLRESGADVTEPAIRSLFRVSGVEYDRERAEAVCATDIDTAIATAGDPDESGEATNSTADSGTEPTRSATERAHNDSVASDDNGRDAEHGANGGRPTADESTPASDFGAACEAVEAVTAVDEAGPVHTYTGSHVSEDSGVRVFALAPEHCEDPKAETAFLDAADSWAGIGKNAGVATVYEVGDEPRPWVAFDGGDSSLAEALPKLDRDQRLAVFADAAEAIRTAGMYNHVHGSLDPQTVRIEDSDEPSAMLSDWGLTRAVESAVGDPPVTGYTAPEQLDGGAATAATDIYRLGVLAGHLLTGREPLAGADDPAAAIEAGDLSPSSDRGSSLSAVEDAVAAALSTDPADRPSSPYHFRRRVRSAME